MDRQYGNISGRISARGSIGGGTVSGRELSGTVEKPETVYVRELEFDTRFNFPNVGDPKTLYIATDENAIYRWDNNNTRYERVGTGNDWHDIEIITGGNA